MSGRVETEGTGKTGMKRWNLRKEWSIGVGILAVLCICLCGCFGGRQKEEAKGTVRENPGVRVTFFNVGKGDAILIETMEHKMLIDAGYDHTSGVILDYLEKQGAERLDYMVLTHFDKDHVGGADWILKEVEVGKVLQPDYESDSRQYLEYTEAAGREGIKVTPVTETMRISLDGAEFLIYPPQRQEYKEEDNDFSLVISMVYGERRFLFAGDCEKERLEELLGQTEFDLAHDVLKVPHHGRAEKNSEEFLKAVSPQIAVITCSEDRPAEPEICDALEKLGTEIYLSSDGTVTCLSDGKELVCFYGEEAPSVAGGVNGQTEYGRQN